MMTKKKSCRQKHQKDAGQNDDTSDEELKSYSNSKPCSHVTKAVNLARVKKTIKNQNLFLEKCKDCKELTIQVSKETREDDKSEDVNEVWLCLQCGYCGCGRMSSNQHSLVHYRTPRSDCHALVLSTSSCQIWCYVCDENICLESSKCLLECVDFITKFRRKYRQNHVIVNGASKSCTTLCDESVPSERISVQSNKTVEESFPLKLKQHDVSAKSVHSAKKNNAGNLRTVKGLRNLGNTCFFNAVIQNLCQTPWLKEELEQRSEKGYQWEISVPVESDIYANDEHPIKVPLFECYPLTLAFVTILKQMTKSTGNKLEVQNPSQLFDQICRKSPQFRGFHQQDSHELLRHLLDGIRNEEIKRQKKAILKAFNLSEKVNPEEVDEKTRQLLKAYGSIVSHTVVDKIFGGQLLSTVLCEECKMSSQVFEPFMDLSLPLAEEKTVRGNKNPKHADEDDGSDDGMHRLIKKDTPNTMSKHQEKKLKQQAKRAAKQKKSKCLKSPKNIAKEKADDAKNLSERLDKLSDTIVSNTQDEDDREPSDADVEDNDESENVSYVVVTNPGTQLDTATDGSTDTQKIRQISGLNERIEELCNQITDIRIRRDSDKQDDLLESIDESERHPAIPKKQKSTHSLVLEEVSDETDTTNWSHTHSEQQAKEWIMRSLTTLSARYQPSSLECSVNSCLNQFTASELLMGSNKFRCENCTNRKREVTGDKSDVVYSNASKQLLIFSPPAVLTLHLKRFQQTGMNLRKLNLFVEFPRILDLAPYCSSICLELPHMAGVKDEVLYSLYAVVQHSGKLTSGHYTAYVKFQENVFNPSFLNICPIYHCSLQQLLQKISKVKMTNGANCSTSDNAHHKWYYISDSFFKEVNETEVLRCQAYLLFYQRIK